MYCSLIATVKAARPELLATYDGNDEPISEEIPPQFFDKQEVAIEGIGSPMTACFFTRVATNPRNW